MDTLLPHIDHLVYATPDVTATMQAVADLLGVTPAVGGRHPVWATRNALLALGPRCYLEIVGPDEQAPPVPPPRPFGLELLSAPRLVTWVAAGADLSQIVTSARRMDVDLGNVDARSRLRPDGSELTWRMTDLFAPREGGVIPYFIDWGDSPHPAAGAPAGCVLLGLEAEHPNAVRVRGILTHLGLDLAVKVGPEPALIGTILSPRGEIELR
ncbi:MAG: VOC family protein [Anaerolineales bacterium]